MWHFRSRPIQIISVHNTEIPFFNKHVIIKFKKLNEINYETSYSSFDRRRKEYEDDFYKNIMMKFGRRQTAVYNNIESYS